MDDARTRAPGWQQIPVQQTQIQQRSNAPGVPACADRIDVSNNAEVSYWMRELSCKGPLLRFAVRCSGVLVVDVTQYLSTRRCIPVAMVRDRSGTARIAARSGSRRGPDGSPLDGDVRR
jgi:hypothetical protein